MGSRYKVTNGVLHKVELLNENQRRRLQGKEVSYPEGVDQEIREIKIHLVPTTKRFLEDLQQALKLNLTTDKELFVKQNENIVKVNGLLSKLIVERGLWKNDGLPKNTKENIYDKIGECDREYYSIVHEKLLSNRYRNGRLVLMKVFSEWAKAKRAKKNLLLVADEFLETSEKKQLASLEGLGLLKYLDNGKICFCENGQHVAKMLGGRIIQIKFKEKKK